MVRAEIAPGQRPGVEKIKGRIIDRSDRALWHAANEENLLPKIVTRGFLQEEELVLLGNIFATKGRKGNQSKVPEELFERFSLAVANTA